MAIWLLGIELVAALWLLAMVLLATTAQVRWARTQRALSLLTLLVATAPLAVTFTYALVLETLADGTLDVFWPMAILTLLTVTGDVVIWLRAQDSREMDSCPDAAAWPIKRLGLAFSGACVILLATFAYLEHGARLVLHELRLEAALWTQSADLPRPRAQDNAASLYELALETNLPATYLSFDDEGHALRDALRVVGREIHGQPLTDEVELAELREFDFGSAELGLALEPYNRSLQLLRVAANKPECNFERSRSGLDRGTLLIESWQLFECARVLAVRARWSAARGDMALALADVDALFEISQHVAWGPLASHVETACDIEALAVKALEAVLVAGEVTAEDLAAISIDDGFSFRAMFDRTIRAESAVALNNFSEIGLNDDWSYLARFVCRSPELPGLGVIYRVLCLPDDLGELRTILRQSPKASGINYEWQKQNLNSRVCHHLLTKLLANNPWQCIDAAFRADTNRRLAVVALALHRHRAQHGAYPRCLDELDPTWHLPLHDVFTSALPVRPYLNLVHRRDGCLLYSVGPDLIDNGGTPWVEATRSGDLVIECRPAGTATGEAMRAGL